MGNLTVNVLMLFGSQAMLSINPDGSVCYHAEGTMIGETLTSSGNYTGVNNDFASDFPTSEGTVVSGSSGSFFTDIFSSILNWFKSAPGLKIVYGVLAGPYLALKCLGLPVEFSGIIVAGWYLISLFVVILTMWGRD